MHPTTHPWLKRFMTACMVMLALQFCFPLTLQASVVSTQRVDMISLGVKDPASKPGVHVDLDVAPPVVILLVPALQDTPTAAPRQQEDVPAPAVLPVAGFHPSAP